MCEHYLVNKYDTQERALLEKVCETVFASEWSDVITNWRARTRTIKGRAQIIEVRNVSYFELLCRRIL